MQAERSNSRPASLFVIIPIALGNANHYHFERSKKSPKIRGLHKVDVLKRLESGRNLDQNGTTLAALKEGETGIIRAIDSACPQVQRLMTLGLVEGAKVERATSAIGGDPIEFRLFGRGISLRAEQAKHFQVATAGASE